MDRFLNQVGRLIYNKDMYDRLGVELGFKKYELEGKYTNSQGENVNSNYYNTLGGRELLILLFYYSGTLIIGPLLGEEKRGQIS